ncbi:hypothetical protein [Flavobacterium sp. 14A]|uniref:hypothetical protein n=1 Tax=Flavobacterium sp. 14A TaxID=2735896 RepID=UPI001570DE78|nr:hypothetical protein [Flavobacterium sp. 14A]NRT12422.1 hypothetical protein [Flavobacterium sp. 14A]
MKAKKVQIITDILWIIIGIFSGIAYYNQKDFVAAGVFLAVALFFIVKIIIRFRKHEKN